MEKALDLRLREIRARLLETDPLLSQVVSMGARNDAPSPVGVVLVLGGYLVQGVPAPSERFAETIDEAIAQFLRALAEFEESHGRDSTEILALAEETLATKRFAQPSRERAEHRRRFWQRVEEAGIIEFPDETTGLPEEMWEDAFFATIKPHAVTLQYASVRGPDGSWEPVEMLRVVLRHVQAWWTTRIELTDDPVL